MKRVVIAIGIGLMPPLSALIGLPISGARTIQPIIGSSGSVAETAASSDCAQNPTGDRGNLTGEANNPNGDPIGEHSGSSNTSAGPSGLTAAASTAATLMNLLPLSNM